jgi:hypothetical protein
MLQPILLRPRLEVIQIDLGKRPVLLDTGENGPREFADLGVFLPLRTLGMRPDKCLRDSWPQGPALPGRGQMQRGSSMAAVGNDDVFAGRARPAP